MSSIPKGDCRSDTVALFSLAVRRRKAVSGRTFKVGSGSRELTSSHQRCDGKRPCTTCVNGERGDGCAYEPWRRSHRVGAGVPPVSRANTPPRPPDGHALPSELLTAGSPISEPVTRPLDVPLLTWPDRNKPTSFPLPPPSPTPYERALVSSSRLRGEIELDPSLGVSVAQDTTDTHDTTECVSRPLVSSFTVLPSIDFRAIPRLLQIPLSLIPPERVQISPITGGDLCMSLYVLRLLDSHVN